MKESLCRNGFKFLLTAVMGNSWVASLSNLSRLSSAAINTMTLDDILAVHVRILETIGSMNFTNQPNQKPETRDFIFL